MSPLIEVGLRQFHQDVLGTVRAVQALKGELSRICDRWAKQPDATVVRFVLMKTAETIARILMRCHAVTISSKQPFVYTSGITSPIYTDNRLLISYPEDREQIVDAFLERIDQVLGTDNLDAVAGTATAGIPWAAWIAARLHKPMIYVRSSSKGHGKERQIEGCLAMGQRLAVIEDHITTGESSLRAVEAIRQAGGVVKHCFAIFTYNFEESRRNYQRLGVESVTLTNIEVLLRVAASEGLISEDDRKAVDGWLAQHRTKAAG